MLLAPNVGETRQEDDWKFHEARAHGAEWGAACLVRVETMPWER
jgi:hypothetical protein